MMKSILKKVLVCVLSAGMVLGLGGVTALAAETPEEAETTETTETLETRETTETPEEAEVFGLYEDVYVPDADALADSDELFAEYVDQVFYGDTGIATLANYGEKILDERDLSVYTQLKALITEVADGSRTSTVFSLETSALTWTAEELGTTSAADLLTAISTKLSGTVSSVIDCLLVDCPYELYWYDKTVGSGYSFGYTYTRNSDGTVASARLTSLTFTMNVAEAYQDGSNTTTNTAKTSAAQTAAANAQGIVAEYESLTDREKVEKYKEEICDLVSYNYDAAYNADTPYGDPWQLIYVFDEDPDTNVVCEGYSKAFQYLCDMGLVDSTSYIVTGLMTGATGAGSHMWNVLNLEGCNYLVDVTNSDTGTIGANGGLFLVDDTDATVVNAGVEYDFLVSRTTITYTYDSSTLSLYSDRIRTLGSTHVLSISEQPSDLTLSYGYSDATLSVKASTDSGTLTYQWYERNADGSAAPIEGATDSILALPDGLEVGSEATYYCVVTHTIHHTTFDDEDTVTSRDAAVTVVAKTLTESMVSGLADTYYYTGEPITPSVTVSDLVDGRELITADDYDVTYADNIGVGTASVTVTGKGNYTGSVTQSFAIQYYDGDVTIQYNGSTDLAAWYREDVVLTADGWTIAAADSTDYAREYTLSGEGTITAQLRFKQDDTGYITDVCTVTVQIDKTAPAFTGSENGIAIKDIWYKELRSGITYDLFYNDASLDVTIVATDDVSGVAAYYYYVDTSGSETALTAGELADKTFTEAQGGAFALTSASDYVVYAYAVDRAGNASSYICSEGFVIDRTAPTLSLAAGDVTDDTASVTASIDKAGTIYCVIKEEAISGLTAEEIINDNTAQTAAVDAADTVSVTFDGLRGNKTYYVYATAVDRAGNVGSVSSCTVMIELEAFAVYSEDDDSLTFYTASKVPEAGSEYKDKTVTTVYENVDSLDAQSYREIPWAGDWENVTSVVIDASFAEAQPINLAYWFDNFRYAEFDGFAYLDTSNVTDMTCMFYYCPAMTSLDVSDWDTGNVTNMSQMFSSCSGLTSLDLSGWDAANVTDMHNMFESCTNLESLNMAGWDTGNVERMGYLFSDCENLTSLDVSGWDTANVTNMRHLFENCKSLASVDVSGWDTWNVERMDYLFANCESLTDVDVADWDTESVTDMDSMFRDCMSLTGVDVSDWEVSGVENMASMFFGCTSLSELDVSDWNTWNVVYMSYMFANCESLTGLDTSEWDVSNVSYLTAMFKGCTNLTDVDVSGWDTGLVGSMNSMFADCTSLTGVDISSWDISSVDDMIFMFQNCESLIGIDISGWDTVDLDTYVYGFAIGCTSLEWVKIGEKTDLFTRGQVVDQQIWYDSPINGNVVSENYMLDVTEPGQYWTYTEIVEAFAVYCEDDSSLTFYTDDTVPAEGDTYDGKTVTTVYEDVDSLRLTSYREVPWRSLTASVTDVVFDDSFEKAQPVSLAYWFCYFSNASFSGLTHIDTSNVEEMESMFFDCSGATSLDVSGWDTSNVTDMGVMFSDCYSLERIEGLSDWDTSSVEYMDSMFNASYSLESVDVADWDVSNVTQMGYMFYDCESLTGIDVANWDTSNVEWMGSMFRTCLSLTDLDVSDWDTSSVTDMSNLFYQCVALPSVDVSGWDTSHVTTMANMFIVCSSLTGLDVSNWDTSSVTNMSGMFQDCVGLTSLDVSGWDTSNVTSMWALFADCFNLESLDVSGWNTSSVTDMEALFGSCASLTGVDVSNWDTSNVRWMNGMFANCESLTSLDLSSWDTGNVTTYENFATGCPALEWVAIGEKTDIFTKGQLVDQQVWYDSPTDGTVVSENYLMDVTEPGQYWTYTETADKGDLEAAIGDADALDAGDYTTDSWDALQTALAAAKTVDADPNATQDEVDEALLELQTAMDNLVPVTPPEVKDGLIKDSDGVWRLYKDDVFQGDYTGFAENKNGDWYVEKGIVTFSVTDILKDKSGAIGNAGDWYYVIGSKVQKDFTGLSNFKNANGWWYIVKGKVDFTRNSVDKNVNGWWYVTGGKVQFGFTGLANYKNENGWWYIKNGAVDFNHNGVDKNVNGWWYVTGGKVQFGFTGLANYRNDNGWWYIEGGKVKFDHTGVEKNVNGWWYVKDSKVDFSYTGTASNRYGTWNIVNGKVRFS